MCSNMDLSRKRLLTDAKLPFYSPKTAFKKHSKTLERDMYGEAPGTGQADYKARLNENNAIRARNSRIQTSLLTGGQ